MRGLAEQWRNALNGIMHVAQSSRPIAGLARRLLFEVGQVSSEDAVALMLWMLSPRFPVPDAAGFFGRFLEGAVQRLMFDAGLRDCIDTWISGLEDESFTEYLPLFRRAFANMDWTEHKRSLDALFGGCDGGATLVLAPGIEKAWPRHLDVIQKILMHPMDDRNRRWRLALGGDDEGLSDDD